MKPIPTSWVTALSSRTRAGELMVQLERDAQQLKLEAELTARGRVAVAALIDGPGREQTKSSSRTNDAGRKPRVAATPASRISG